MELNVDWKIETPQIKIFNFLDRKIPQRNPSHLIETHN